VLRVIDEFDEPLGSKLIRQSLYPLAAGGPHLGDLRYLSEAPVSLSR